jgi:hypothetical protein
MGATAAAFRMVWRPHAWEGGNVDIVFMEDDPLEPFRRGFAAVGLRARIMVNESVCHLVRDPARRAYLDAHLVRDETPFREAIIERIDAGVPLIALGVVGPPEASIITGYRDDADTLVGWSMFQSHLDPVHNLPRYPEDRYFARAGWFAETHALFVPTVEDPPTLESVYCSSLAVISRTLSRNRVHGFVTGLAAFDAYLDMFLDDSEFAGRSQDELAVRKMAHYDAMTMIAERAPGAEFLRTIDEALCDELREGQERAIETAADACEDAAREMHAWWEIVGPIGHDEEAQIAATVDPTVRRRFAENIRKARDLHATAAAALSAV